MSKRTNRKMTRQCASLRHIVMVNKVVIFWKKKATNKHRIHMAEMDKGFTLGLETHETNDRF